MHKTIKATRIFTGDEWLSAHTVVVENGIIQSLQPTVDVDGDGSFLAPAFIDVQVYGAAGKLFSAHPTAETLRLMGDVFRQQGTALFQPTLATNTIAVFKQAIDAVRQYWDEGGTGVHGLHLEGPWLNPAKRGAHIESLIHPPTAAEAKDLLEYGKGVIKMITVAPEVCSDEVIALLLLNGIVVSAGHTDATYGQAMNGFGKGITAVTHLYNAMSPLHHREPGLVGATLQHPSVMASIIPDGHHVDFAAIAIAKRLMGERLFAITDAVTDTTEGPYQHYLAGDKYECNGTLSGSALSMQEALRRLVNGAGIEVGEALRMCALYPAKALGINEQYGRIVPGYKAAFVRMNAALEITEVII